MFGLIRNVKFFAVLSLVRPGQALLEVFDASSVASGHHRWSTQA